MNKKITLALVFIFALSFVGAMLPLFTGGAAANANSAQTSWMGTTQQGVVYAGSGTCPLMVTSEAETGEVAQAAAAMTAVARSDCIAVESKL